MLVPDRFQFAGFKSSFDKARCALSFHLMQKNGEYRNLRTFYAQMKRDCVALGEHANFFNKADTFSTVQWPYSEHIEASTSLESSFGGL